MLCNSSSILDQIALRSNQLACGNTLGIINANFAHMGGEISKIGGGKWQRGRGHCHCMSRGSPSVDKYAMVNAQGRERERERGRETVKIVIVVVGQVGSFGWFVCMTKFCISNATSQKTCIDTCISYVQHINKIPAAAASGQTHTNIMIISFSFSVSAVYTLWSSVA